MINSCLKCIEDSLDLPIVLGDHLLKTKKIQKFKEKGDSRYIYQNEIESLVSIWHGLRRI